MTLVALTTLRHVVPHPIAITEALLKITTVDTAVLPGVLAESLWKTIHEFPFKFVSVKVVLYSLSMLEAVLEVPEVEVS
jgi:hypothetical protein